MKSVSVETNRPEWLESLWGLGSGLQLAVLAVLVLGLLWVAWRRLRPAPVARCRWKRDKIRRSSGLERWQCMNCGVDSFTRDGKAPKECKREAREISL